MSWTKTQNKNRASGLIIKDDKVLLIHRIRADKEYWVVPGGGVEEGESIEQALDREMMEELGIQVKEKELLFEIENAGRSEHYFLVRRYVGEPEMGGPELERMNEQNQYVLEEKNLTNLSEINLLPKEITNKLKNILAGVNSNPKSVVDNRIFNHKGCVVVKKSLIGQFPNGKGVFADRDFKKGEVVIQYHLKPLTQEEWDKLPQGEKEFTHTHQGQIYLYSEPERYVNHSIDPNTYQDLRNKQDIAFRNIKRGEEITTDATKDEI